MYTILDLLDKFIDIEESSYKIYDNIVKTENIPQPIRTMAGVLAREEIRHVKIYKNLKVELEEKDGLEIDFELYDRIHKVVSDFKRRMADLQINDINDLLKYALDFEKDNLAMVISVQGILVRKLEDEETKPYEALTKLIKEEQGHIANIERFIY